MPSETDLVRITFDPDRKDEFDKAHSDWNLAGGHGHTASKFQENDGLWKVEQGFVDYLRKHRPDLDFKVLS